MLARELNKALCKQSDADTWQIPILHAAVVAWWIAEYTGWYVEEQAGTSLEAYDLDEGIDISEIPRATPNKQADYLLFRGKGEV